MKVVTERTVRLCADAIHLGYLHPEHEDWNEIDPKNINEAAKHLKCSPELLEALIESFKYIPDTLREDFNDIDKRLTALEERK